MISFLSNTLKLLLLVSLLSGCALVPRVSWFVDEKPYTGPRGLKPYTIKGKTYYPLASARNFSETGLASWYGKPFHGRKTANGETYNMYAMTAAHTILPLNTTVRVTHLRSGKSVVVRINDRGPFVSGRVIDLSLAAARKLNMEKSGVTRVRVEAIDTR